MVAARLLKSPILTWECITALQIRWAWLSSSLWAVWWQLYFFAIPQVHSVDIEFLLCALSVWCGCSRTRYHCRFRDLVDVKNPKSIGSWWWKSDSKQSHTHKQARSRTQKWVRAYYMLYHYTWQRSCFKRKWHFFDNKTLLKIEKDL